MTEKALGVGDYDREADEKRLAEERKRIARDGPDLKGAKLEARLDRTWHRPPGIVGWLATVDHKEIGRRYIVTALIFLALGGALALLMRMQLARPDNAMIGASRFNELFTMHGSTMMFLFAVPVMEGVAVYVIPLMLGTRSTAFPRLNSFSYYMYLFGGLLLWGAFVLNIAPDIGWFAYTPLSGPQFSPGKRADIWAQMITFTEVSALAAAVVLVCTILKARAPGMTLARMPLFAWAMLVTSLMIIFAMPSVALASGMLISDRLVGTQFYNHYEHGDALLWQHLFWFFGHPEVYIIFLPATGFVSVITETFCRRPVFAYPVVVLALISTGILAFGLWVHHMFATGLPRVGYSFYTAASMSVAIPTGLQIFCWLATMWDGRPRFQVPMLYVVGFIITFVIGGLTGVMVAAVPLDLQLHDTYFVVAHFHYVLIGGAVFPLLGILTYWFPKITGRMMSETLGKIGFWMIFLGFQLAFFPMHWSGLMGMPRRVYTYPAGLGLEIPNLLSTLGAFVVALAVLLFVINGLWSLYRGAIAPANPWGAPSLEWATASPPPVYNFAHIPVVESRTPLWDEKGALPVVTGLRVDDKEMLLTTVVAATPDMREPIPEASLWPFIAACATAVFFIASIFSPWAVVFGSIPCAIALAAWFWPKKIERHPEPVINMIREVRFTEDLADLPTHKFGPASLTWWGIIGYMIVEGGFFALAFAAYFFLMGHEQGWPPEGRAAPDLLAGTLFTIVMLLSEIPNTMIKKAAQAHDTKKVRALMPGIIGIGAVLLIIRAFEFNSLNCRWTDNAYASILWALLFLHTVHLLTDWGDTIVLWPLMKTPLGYEGRRLVDTDENALYWRYVWIMWIPIYLMIYWVPRL